MTGKIFDIQRFCVHDGPGIRTTVFLKGCPLRCLWCHNPESQTSEPETLFYRERCVGCGRCREAATDPDFVCFHGAREVCGKTVSTDEVLAQVLRDRLFYQNSGGGVTLSGGEPLAQHAFCRELLQTFKQHDLHTAIETSGFASRDHFKSIAAYVDLFLFDYKEADPHKHRQFTGVDNAPILENLALLAEMRKPVILRCPIVPGCNDRNDHFEGIAQTVDRFENVLHVELMPYHSLGEGKRAALGKEGMPFAVAGPEQKEAYLHSVRCRTSKKVILSE